VHVVEDPTTNREEMEKEFRDLCLDMKCPLEEFSFVGTLYFPIGKAEKLNIFIRKG
jgi:hypothetical protein